MSDTKKNENNSFFWLGLLFVLLIGTNINASRSAETECTKAKLIIQNAILRKELGQ